MKKHFWFAIVLVVISSAAFSATPKKCASKSPKANAQPTQKDDTLNDKLRSSNQYNSSLITLRSNIKRINADLKQLIAQMGEVGQQLDMTNAKVNLGAADASDVIPLKSKLSQLETQIDVLKDKLQDANRVDAISHPISVTLKSADIRKAAEALSQAAKVKITVDEKVPKNLYVSIQATEAPLGAILEVIANTAKLTIVPSDDGGIVLKIPGKILVNGENVDLKGSNEPWSDEWGIVYVPNFSDRFLRLGRRWQRLYDIIGIYYPSSSSSSQSTGWGGMQSLH
jgi:hypothetical protein